MNTFEEFSVLLKDWFEVHGVTEHLQRRLFEKLCNDIFDAGGSFSLAAVVDEDSDETDEKIHNEEDTSVSQHVLIATKKLQAKEDIWLVDHCCTFNLREFRVHLEANDALRKRLGLILSLNLSHTDPKEDTQAIFDHMWKKVSSYKRLPVSDDAGDYQYENTWFFHDEVGSAIMTVTDGTENMKLEPMPVFFPEKGGVFSVMWCVEDMEEGAIAMRAAVTVLENIGGREVVELLYGSPSTERRDCAYAEAKRVCVEAWRKLAEKLATVSQPPATFVAQIPAETNTLGTPSGRISLRNRQESLETGETEPKLPLRVFTDSNLVANYLTDAHYFLTVDLPQEANVIWMTHDPIEDFHLYRDAMFISQFPEEHIFTSKQGLLRLIQERYGYVEWYQTSYDTTSQLQEFIGDFIVRQAHLKRGDDDSFVTDNDTRLLRNNDGTNLWITKPANMARSIDMTVSSNLDTLLKAIETGPKIVSKYIANTATLRQRKFDLRFIVAVRAFSSNQKQLDAFVYDVFWTRFALEDYALNEFDKYEKHWTVMNYANPEKLLQLHDCDFIKEFNAEYAAKGYESSLWNNNVYPKILKMLRDAFSAVNLRNTAYNNRCRAIYGVDVMLRHAVCEKTGKKTFEPSLLEITYSPDCYRACKYHPNFFNDVFQTLFLGKQVNMTRL